MADSHTVFPLKFDATFGDGHPTSDSDLPIETIHELLSNAADFGLWTLTPPQIEYQWDVSQQSRENNPNPVLYLWSPSEGSFESFSADGDLMNQSSIVEISVWTLDAIETARYAEDVVDILSSYFTDNYANSTFNTVRPSNIADHRNEKVARTTDHYVISVQIDLGKLRPTG